MFTRVYFLRLRVCMFVCVLVRVSTGEYGRGEYACVSVCVCMCVLVCAV